jgi:hypothetical protein
MGYIIGTGGRGIRNLVGKWGGRIIEASANHPVPQFGRYDNHITIIGEERAVHLLALEINDMIKVSMMRTETRLKGEMNKADSQLQNQQAKDLKIAELEEELRQVIKEVSLVLDGVAPDDEEEDSSRNTLGHSLLSVEEDDEEDEEEEEDDMIFTGSWVGANNAEGW